MADKQHTKKDVITHEVAETAFQNGYQLGIGIKDLIDALQDHNSDIQIAATHMVADMLAWGPDYPSTADFLTELLNRFRDIERG